MNPTLVWIETISIALRAMFQLPEASMKSLTTVPALSVQLYRKEPPCRLSAALCGFFYDVPARLLCKRQFMRLR